MPYFLKKILEIMPATFAAKVIFHLSGKPFKYRVNETESDWLNATESFEYDRGKWAYKYGEGPLVVLVHGWGGAAGQWYLLAKHLVAKGYSIVAPDISSHGRSAGNHISFKSFIEDIGALQNALSQKVSALVGHSAGGLAMMSARARGLIEAEKFVCIATPSHPYPPIKIIKKKMRLSEKVESLIKKKFAGQFFCEWEKITESCFVDGTGNELLLIYDKKDRYLDPGDLEAILEFWPSAKSLLVDGIGHAKMIQSKVCIKEIASFLEQEAKK